MQISFCREDIDKREREREGREREREIERERRTWQYDVKDWTGLSFAESQRLAHDIEKWRVVVSNAFSAIRCL